MGFFFIVGVGRSGTSLLQSILSSHSKICIPPETAFVRENILSVKRQPGFTEREIESANKKVQRILSASSVELPKSFSDEPDFYHSLFKMYCEEQNKEIVGDKDPRLIEFIEAVSMLFKDAQFIHLVRDPRDVLLSKKKAEWSKGKPSWYHTFANYVQLKMGERQGRKLSVDQYLTITYESLLASPENIIEKLCVFLDAEFEVSMLSFQDKAKELVSEDEKQWKKETMGPLLKDNTGKWKGKLSDWEIALTERLCKQAFSLGGYQFSGSYNNLSSFQKITVSLTVQLLQLLGCFYIPYRLYSQKLIVAWKY